MSMTQEEIFKEMEKMLSRIPSIAKEVMRIKGLGHNWELRYYDIEDGFLHISFIRYYRGDNDYDDAFIPASALWDDSWAPEYEQGHKDRLEKEARICRELQEKQSKLLLEQERAQYEKLKKKFEGAIDG